MLLSFGLTPEYRLNVYTIIHDIVFNGKGGYTWSEVYNMPIWVRRFTFEKIKQFYEKEQEDIDKQQKKLTNKSEVVSRPNIPQPSYSTKAAKK